MIIQHGKTQPITSLIDSTIYAESRLIFTGNVYAAHSAFYKCHLTIPFSRGLSWHLSHCTIEDSTIEIINNSPQTGRSPPPSLSPIISLSPSPSPQYHYFMGANLMMDGVIQNCRIINRSNHPINLSNTTIWRSEIHSIHPIVLRRNDHYNTFALQLAWLKATCILPVPVYMRDGLILTDISATVTVLTPSAILHALPAYNSAPLYLNDPDNSLEEVQKLLYMRQNRNAISARD